MGSWTDGGGGGGGGNAPPWSGEQDGDVDLRQGPAVIVGDSPVPLPDWLAPLLTTVIEAVFRDVRVNVQVSGTRCTVELKRR